VASLERRKRQNQSLMVGRTSCFVASARVTTIVVVVVVGAAAAVARTCCTEFDVAVQGGGRAADHRRPHRLRSRTAIAKI